MNNEVWLEFSGKVELIFISRFHTYPADQSPTALSQGRSFQNHRQADKHACG